MIKIYITQMILKSLLERVRDDVTRANDVSERKLIRIDFRTKVKTKRPLDHETKKNTSTAKLFRSAYSY